jgi:hypothetical protein
VQPGDRRRNEAHAGQLAHQVGQSILGQEMAVQKIDHNGADVRTVLEI